MRKLFATLSTLVIALIASSAAAGPVAFANTSSGQFGTIDLGSGAFTSVGFTPTVLSGVATTSSVVYGVDAFGNLVTINPSNAAVNVVGNTGINVVVFAGLTNGALYGLDYSNNLYSINSTTGAATFVGATGLAAIPNDAGWSNGLAGDASTLYLSYEYGASISHSGLAETLFRINPSNGSTSAIGRTFTTTTTGLGFVDGRLWGPGQIGSTLNVFDFNSGTGVGSFVAPLSGVNGLVYGVAAPVPEPMTMTLIGTGLLFGLRRRMR
jgi:hypothetical protein